MRVDAEADAGRAVADATPGDASPTCDGGVAPVMGGGCVASGEYGSWGASAERIETEILGDARYSQIAVDVAGNAVAVWSQHDGVRYSMMASSFVVGAGWSVPELIETDDAGSAFDSQIVFDQAGTAVVVWQQANGTGQLSDIWSNRYVAGAGWGVAELVENDSSGSASSPQIAVDAENNAIAVWYQTGSVRSNRYVVGVGWGTPEILSGDSYNVRDPQLAVDSAGNAFAVWAQTEGNDHDIWSSRYVEGVGWGTAELIVPNGEYTTTLGAQIAVDAAGNAIAVWGQDEDGGFIDSIWSNRYVMGFGWAGAERIASDIDAEEPQIAMDGAGNAVVVWLQYGVGGGHIAGRRYVPGSGWETEPVDSDNTGGEGQPQIAMNRDGHAVAVWTKYDGETANVVASQYVSGVAWHTPELIENDNAGHAYEPSVDVNGSGVGVAVWVQFDGETNSIWSNRIENLGQPENE